MNMVFYNDYDDDDDDVKTYGCRKEISLTIKVMDSYRVNISIVSLLVVLEGQPQNSPPPSLPTTPPPRILFCVSP